MCVMRAEEIGYRTREYRVLPGDIQVVQVAPVQKAVTLKDTRKIFARTICFRFQGEWLPVSDVVVDKVRSCFRLAV